MAKFNVIVNKVNCGVSFLLESKSKRLTESKREQEALSKAIDLYREGVIKAFADAGVSTTGYAHDFVNRAWPQKSGTRSRLMPLEPWGFVVKGFMGDSGSTPTEGRARILECYQAGMTYDPESKEIRGMMTVEVQ